jgi:subtilisin-like proprotein convertase family protein
MLHIFAAGNAGLGGSQTIESPGTAKNVLTVGATENVRDDGIADGCGWTNSNNADDIATFSSRGPTTDQRTKPDIMAPGIHVQGPASQDPTYNATGICGSAGSPKLYYPAGQTLYSWSSGTSHSTPAVAGAASLLYNYYGRVLNPGQTPSPAMLKALLLNSPRYLNGNETGGTLPSNNQGWGDANLGMLFDGTPRFLQDQNFTFNATGQVYTKTMAVADNTKPLRVSLVWTDAPGSTTGNAYVNDLNLEVTVGGNTYKGNVFLGANSTTGGAFDTRNNVENVFLPAGVSGTLSVKVTAANLAANAIPGSGFTTAQDFALVVYNANNPVPAPVIVQNNISFSDANGNGLIDPGETVNLNLALGNGGDTGASGVTGVVAVTGGNATIVQNSSAYANIAPGAVVTNTTPYSFTVNPGAACGSIITFTQTVSYSEVGSPVSFNFSLPTGQTQLGNPVTYTSTDIPKAIPDDVATGITSTVGINSSKPVGKVTVKVNITHTWVGDLVIKLISPQGTAVTLASRPGSSGNNGDNLKDIVFDDAAATPIANLPVGQTDYTGSYRPDTPLSALNGQAINGTWKLVVADVASQDTGTLNSWSLNIQPALYICGPFSITPNSGTTPQAAGLNNPFPGLLQATVLDVASQPVAGVNVTFTAPGSGASGTFQGGGTTYITTTNSSGIATAPPFSANSTAGSYAVTATVASAATPATFNLSNLTPCIVVSNTSDTGSPGTCGTLSYAMQSASPGDTITFNLGANNHTVSVTGPLPALAPGAKIDGGSCAAGPNIIIQAVPGAGATNGLILTSNNWLMNLKITGFPNRQITVPNGGGNHLGQCVVAVR